MSIEVPSSSSDLASCVAPQMLASVEYAFSFESRYGRPARSEPFAHLRPPAELVDEQRIEPRLVDPQRRVDEQPIAVEALDVVALVRRTVPPDIDPVGVHRADEQRAGHRPAERGGVEVRLAGGGDVERPALERDQAFVDELLATVDQPGFLGAIELGPLGHGVQFRLVVLPEIGGVGVGDRALLPHPGHGRGGVSHRRRRSRRARRRAGWSAPWTWRATLPRPVGRPARHRRGPSPPPPGALSGGGRAGWMPGTQLAPVRRGIGRRCRSLPPTERATHQAIAIGLVGQVRSPIGAQLSGHVEVHHRYSRWSLA